jgi:RNA polymerase sigma factor (TIGR02999 family)
MDSHAAKSTQNNGRRDANFSAGASDEHILEFAAQTGDSVSDDLPVAPPPTPGGGMDIAALSATAYDELRGLARARLRSNGPLTLLDTTGLVSDTFRRLAVQHNLHIESRAHFLGYCSRIMRSVIIDLVRERNAERRGGGERKITLNTEIGEGVAAADEPLRVDDALAELAKREPRLAQVVEMRYFGGYNEEEVAEALGLTTRTVQRDWRKARVLLRTMLSDSD